MLGNTKVAGDLKSDGDLRGMRVTEEMNITTLSRCFGINRSREM